MQYSSQLHGAKHCIKAILGRTEMIFNGIRKNPAELLVLNYHGTQQQFLPDFEKQLDFLQRHFTFASPADLELHYSGQHSTQPKVLLTFDDGIKNNIHAAKILHQRNIGALFLIIPGFVDCPAEKQAAYFRNNIRPDINRFIDKNEEDVSAMSWEELHSLISMQHVIGCHSMTHQMVAANMNNASRDEEVVNSKLRLEEKLGIRVEYFCGPNNSLLSCGVEEMKLIKKHYKYFLSTVPGSNSNEVNPYFIKRSNVESFWMEGAFINAIGNWTLKRWEEKRNQFEYISGPASSSPSTS